MDNVTRLLMQGAAGASGDKTYIDDVFHIQVHGGTSATRTINNGIDLAGEGGLIWAKTRNVSNSNHTLFDTVRGATKYLSSSSNNAELTYSGNGITSFNNNGYTLGDDSSWQGLNHSGNNYVLNTFRKAPGFFDIVTYTGNSQANRVVTHNLGSVPGCIMIKKITGSIEDWRVYHRGTDPENPGDYYLRLNQNHARNDADTFMDTIPTSTQFLVNSYSDVNANGETYVAYIFAGGASTSATARSVNFARSSSQGLSLASTSDFAYGTGDFTVEAWIKLSTDTGTFYFVDHGGDNFSSGITSNQWFYYNGSAGTQYGGNATENIGSWTHFAISRSSGTTKIFINGVERNSFSDTHNFPAQNTNIGHYQQSQHFLNGNISNLRIVKGTALYTESFRPPYETLTNISGTVLLCCNNASVTGATVTPGAITAHNTPTASTNSPFDDPEGFKFGEEGDQNIIKTGMYTGNGSDGGPEVYLGWEPQWVMLKRTDSTDNWPMYDVMRGITTGGTDNQLRADQTAVEHTTGVTIAVTPTGFKLETLGSEVNANNGNYVYIAIRRPDGYVGKPAEVATEVFAIDTWVSDSTPAGQPNMISNFPVDFVLDRDPTYDGSWQGNWHVRGRLIQNLYVQTQSTAAEGTGTWGQFDYSTGWMNRQGLTGYTNWQSWMFKRHAGFDVVTYDGNGSTKTVNHSLGRVPEMIWIKDRSTSQNWLAYHKGLNGGTTPWNYHILLNTTGAEGAYSFINQPTTIDFAVTSGWQGNGGKYIAMLFASVDGISKVGSYVGQGSDLTVEFGFSPRFLMVKRIDSTGDWNVFDTTRGLVSGADKELRLNNTSAQSDHEVGDITSTGFTFACGGSHDTCSAGGTWIYYAHA